MERRGGKCFLNGALTFLALYAALWSVGWVLGRAFDRAFSGRDIRVLAESVSPGREYVATSYVDSGGGAAGWCQTKADVRKVGEPFDPPKSFAFMTNCGAEVDLNWEGDRRLLVTYTTDGTGASLYQKTLSDDRAVEIFYAKK